MPRKILFLEDDRLFRRLIIPTLTKAGYEVVEAPKLKDAWQALHAHGETFDLYLIDGLLPDGKGETLIEFLRNSRRLTTPIIFVSAYWKDFATYRRLTTELAVNFVLSKPISPQDLFRHIDDAITAYEGGTAVEEEQQDFELIPDTGASLDGALVAPYLPTDDLTDPEPDTAEFAAVPESIVPDAVEIEIFEEDPVVEGTVTGEIPGIESLHVSEEDDVDDDLESYREVYRKALPQKLAAVRDAAQACETDPDDKALRLQACKLIQRIARTASAYDMLNEAEAAGRIELELRAEKPAWSAVQACIDEALSKSLRGEATAASVPAFATILAVHSNPEVLNELEQFGESTLVHTVTAPNIADAAAATAGQRIDGILLGIDHVDKYVAMQSEATSPWRGAPVAIVAPKDHGDFAHRVAAEFTDAMQFMTEPIDAAMFAETVHAFLHSTWNQKPRVLIVSDEETFTDFVTSHLQPAGIQGTALHTAAAIFNTLDVGQADFVLIDGEMLDVSPANLIRSIRMHPHWDTMPVAVLSARLSPTLRMAAFRAGCDDYIDGKLAHGELVARIDARIVRWRLLRERFERDPLTGLLNSKSFSEMYEALVGEPSNQPVCVSLIELAEFKSLNERHGRAAGDMMLSVLGHLLYRHAGEGAICGRNEGASFSMALAADCGGIAQKLEALARDFARQRFHGLTGETFSALIQWGTATSPEDGSRSDALFRRAKARLVAARKRRG